MILDGTLIPIDRIADQKPYYSGKHKKHGVNVQVIADAAGRLVWASPALPGSVHDLTAARIHGLIDALTSNNVLTFAEEDTPCGQGSSRGGGRCRKPEVFAVFDAGLQAVVELADELVEQVPQLAA